MNHVASFPHWPLVPELSHVCPVYLLWRWAERTAQGPPRPLQGALAPSSRLSFLQLPLRFWGRKRPTGHPSEAECCGSLCGPTLRLTQAPLSQDEGPGLQRPSGTLDGGTRVATGCLELGWQGTPELRAYPRSQLVHRPDPE